MRVLFQCNTVYQLFVALKIKYDYHQNDVCDLIVSDIFNGYKKIANNIKKINIFNNVYTQKIKESDFGPKNLLIVNQNTKHKLNIDSFNFSNYDKFYFSNASDCNIAIYLLLKKINKKIKINLYEDGLATYSLVFGDIFNKANTLKALFTKKRVLNKIDNIYVFNKEFFQWSPKSNIIGLGNKFSSKFISDVNYIFDYNNETLPDDCKVLYFEEGFFGDGKIINDKEIIQFCIDKFGKSNFYIKLHPRNKVNRFKDSDIKVLPNASIPWELLVINNLSNIEKMTLITITSAAVFTPTLIFGIKPKVYSCIKMIDNKEALFKHIPEIEKTMIDNYDNISYL